MPHSWPAAVALRKALDSASRHVSVALCLAFSTSARPTVALCSSCCHLLSGHVQLRRAKLQRTPVSVDGLAGVQAALVGDLVRPLHADYGILMMPVKSLKRPDASSPGSASLPAAPAPRSPSALHTVCCCVPASSLTAS